MHIQGIVNFSNKGDIRSFDTACILQIISKTSYNVILCSRYKNYFTDKSSCTVEVYKVINETELTSVVNPTFCSYTWGNCMHKFID